MGGPIRRRGGKPRGAPGSKPASAPENSTEWLKRASNPESWMTYAESLRRAAHAVSDAVQRVFWEEFHSPPEQMPDDPPELIRLPGINVDFLLGEEGPL